MHEISYQVVRSDRKNVALVIDNDANLIVRAPNSISDKTITELVHKKKKWINNKHQQVEVFGAKYPLIVVETGESIMYLGSTYSIIKADVDAVEVSGNELLVSEKYNIDDMTAWLKEQSILIIEERVKFYSSIMGVTPESVKVSDAKTRWGSCSSRNALYFAWRLVMCPLSTIDYVVVHELSHITYKNHSPEFWARVKTVLPTYKDEQEWLKMNKQLMDII